MDQCTGQVAVITNKHSDVTVMADVNVQPEVNGN